MVCVQHLIYSLFLLLLQNVVLYFCKYFFVCYNFQSSLDNRNRSWSGFCQAYLSSSLSVSIKTFFFLDAVFCDGYGNLGIRGVSFARGFENIASGAASAGLLLSRDSECLPGVGGLERDSDESLEGLDEDDDEDHDKEDEKDEDEVSAYYFFFFLVFF